LFCGEFLAELSVTRYTQIPEKVQDRRPYFAGKESALAIGCEIGSVVVIVRARISSSGVFHPLGSGMKCVFIAVVSLVMTERRLTVSYRQDLGPLP
jgi:hypothetical protein